MSARDGRRAVETGGRRAAVERGRAGEEPLRIVICGLSITSSWGNGHASTYRALVRELVRLGHSVLFLERDVPWYAANRDLPRPPWGRTELYEGPEDLFGRFGSAIRKADLAVVGSYVPDGVEVGHRVAEEALGVTAFYDIDTPVTLEKLAREDHEYLEPALIPRFDLYLSFSGGPTLRLLEREYGARRALHLPCSVDPDLYRPDEDVQIRWDLGYMGTYSDDRQPPLARLLLEPARGLPERSFAVVGPGYPPEVEWPANVERIEHLPPDEHRSFYTAQRFTLNVTRAQMVRLGHSPSVRLFEAAACATPIISDRWEGLNRYFEPDREILVVDGATEVQHLLTKFPEEERRDLGRRARRRVLREHTAAHRAARLVDLARRGRRASGAARA